MKTWNVASGLLSASAKERRFTLEDLMGSALTAAGHSDFGDQRFQVALERLLGALNERGDFHAFGRFYVEKFLVGLLVHRLTLADYWSRHPAIFDRDIRRPVVILGMPRTGTSLLFNLIAQDPSHRTLTNWETSVSQVPPKGSYTYQSDPRRSKGRHLLRFQKYLMPGIDKLHAFTLDGPEECTPILMQGFTTQAFVGMFDVPGYSSWLDRADHTDTYLHHRRVLQTLQEKYPGERWLLKSPDHIAAIDAILKVYPDACIVHTYRDPAKAVASWASLALYFRNIYYRRVDTAVLGVQVLDRLAGDIDRFLSYRRDHGGAAVLDIGYDALVGDPMAVVNTIYERFDLHLSAEARENMRRYLDSDRRHQPGAHVYRPEDFGLTAAGIRNRFEHYLDSFAPS